MSVEQLIRHRFFSARQPEIVLNDTSSGTIKNYRLSVVVSADGKHFTAALVPIEGCGTALFSDEAALIYQGQVLGCSDR